MSRARNERRAFERERAKKLKRIVTLPQIVAMHRRGEINRERAIEMAYETARLAADIVDGGEHDVRNGEKLLDRVTVLPVEDWEAEWSFWMASICLDAPWIVWKSPMEIN